MYYIIFDLFMAVIFALTGLWFYKSDGNARDFIAGWSTMPEEIRRKCNEKETRENPKLLIKRQEQEVG